MCSSVCLGMCPGFKGGFVGVPFEGNFVVSICALAQMPGGSPPLIWVLPHIREILLPELMDYTFQEENLLSSGNRESVSVEPCYSCLSSECVLE